VDGIFLSHIAIPRQAPGSGRAAGNDGHWECPSDSGKRPEALASSMRSAARERSQDRGRHLAGVDPDEYDIMNVPKVTGALPAWLSLDRMGAVSQPRTHPKTNENVPYFKPSCHA
jgi:hypothetical protein